MNNTFLSFLIIALLCGCEIYHKQTAECIVPSRLNIRISPYPDSWRRIYRLGEPLNIMIMLQRNVDDMILIPEAYYSAIIKVDGKDFRNLDKGKPINWWSGPIFTYKDKEEGHLCVLSKYFGINQEILSIGNHEIVVTIGNDVSNTLKITILETEEMNYLDASIEASKTKTTTNPSK